MNHSIAFAILVLIVAFSTAMASRAADASTPKEYHVSVNGNDANDGSTSHMLKTISAASASLAQPGDTITVHAGVYRERINPPRGGESDSKRITYQAAPGEIVEITGSEVIKGWEKVGGDTWKTTIPNKFFGSFNPYSDLIHGDWFSPEGRQHHTGAVYLNGDWLIEAAHFGDVLNPARGTPLWYVKVDGATDVDYIVNVASLTVAKQRIAADSFAGKDGELHPAPCSEGGNCVGWIRPGSSLIYRTVNFGQDCRTIELRTASTTNGCDIELRLDGPTGELLGVCPTPGTGDWQNG